MTLTLRALLFSLTLALPAGAQQAQIAFGSLSQDTSLPVEIEADQLSVDNASGQAEFAGNVRVGQGEMRLAATKVVVEYGEDGSQISRLLASGGVVVTNQGEAAEASDAIYSIDAGTIVMTGDVLLTQGASALSGNQLTIRLKDGTGVMEGRVATTFVPGSSK